MPISLARPQIIISKIVHDLASLRAEQRGTIAVMMAFLLPIMVGGLGLGFEVSNWYLQTRSMQNAADAAAIAAASNGRSNYDVEAKAVTAQYGFVSGTNNVIVTASNTAACPAGGNTCYSVTISSVVPLYLSQVVGYTGDTTANGVKEKTLSSAAVAKQATVQQPICLLGLSQAGQALRTDGAPNSNFTGCSVMSNSDANCNGSNLQANYGLAHGTNNGCGNKQESGVPIVPDPYSALATNIPTNTCGSGANAYPQEPVKKKDPALPAKNNWSVSKSLSGNVQMCGDVQLTGDVIINTPDNLIGATLVIENGQLDLNGHTLSTANGSAVTIVFSGTAGNYTHAPIDNSGGGGQSIICGTNGSCLNIQAPSSPSAPFASIAIYQDPNMTTPTNFTYAGNSPTWDITGAVYMPYASVDMKGAINKSANGAVCMVMVANDVTVDGTGSIYAQTPDGSGCKSAGLNMPTATIRGRAQLVY